MTLNLKKCHLLKQHVISPQRCSMNKFSSLYLLTFKQVYLPVLNISSSLG